MTTPNTMQQQSPQRTLEQERAKQAWLYISAVKTENEPLAEKKRFAKEYKSLAQGASADIQLNGLGQSLAFWRAKGKGEANEHTRLFDHISDWVKRQNNIAGTGNLLEWVVSAATTDEYRRATAETVAFLVWIKRFAEAELDQKKPTTEATHAT